MMATVVIPARDESRMLAECLRSLSEQRTRHDFKVVLVDNASSDDTVAVASAWRDKLPLTIVFEPRVGRGAARRAGFEKADTAIILSTDADTTVPANWLEELINALLDNPNAAAVTTSCYIADGKRIANWTMRLGMPLSLRLYRLFEGHYLLSGSTFAIRRSAYEESGGFDTSIDMLEDVDLAFRVARVGRIIYRPQPRVLTAGDIFGRGYLKGFWYYFKPYLHRYVLHRRPRRI